MKKRKESRILTDVHKVKRGVHEVLAFIMFNWIAYYLSNYAVNLPALHKEGGGEATKDILETAQMTISGALAGMGGACQLMGMSPVWIL